MNLHVTLNRHKIGVDPVLNVHQVDKKIFRQLLATPPPF